MKIAEEQAQHVKVAEQIKISDRMNEYLRQKELKEEINRIENLIKHRKHSSQVSGGQQMSSIPIEIPEMQIMASKNQPISDEKTPLPIICYPEQGKSPTTTQNYDVQTTASNVPTYQNMAPPLSDSGNRIPEVPFNAIPSITQSDIKNPEVQTTYELVIMRGILLAAIVLLIASFVGYQLFTIFKAYLPTLLFALFISISLSKYRKDTVNNIRSTLGIGRDLNQQKYKIKRFMHNTRESHIVKSAGFVAVISQKESFFTNSSTNFSKLMKNLVSDPWTMTTAYVIYLLYMYTSGLTLLITIFAWLVLDFIKRFIIDVFSTIIAKRGLFSDRKKSKSCMNSLVSVYIVLALTMILLSSTLFGTVFICKDLADAATKGTTSMKNYFDKGYGKQLIDQAELQANDYLKQQMDNKSLAPILEIFNMHAGDESSEQNDQVKSPKEFFLQKKLETNETSSPTSQFKKMGMMIKESTAKCWEESDFTELPMCLYNNLGQIISFEKIQVFYLKFFEKLGNV